MEVIKVFHITISSINLVLATSKGVVNAAANTPPTDPHSAAS
jgi:hypothetical protein